MTAAEMNSMILENIGDQLREQIDDSIKGKLSKIYKDWLRSIIKAEAPVLSGQVTRQPTEETDNQGAPAPEEEASA